MTVRDDDDILAAGELERLQPLLGEGGPDTCTYRMKDVDLQGSEFFTVEVGEFVEEYGVSEVDDGALTINTLDFQLQRSIEDMRENNDG